VNVGSVIAFRDRDWAPPGVAVRVNFGVFAGREATPAEIEDLAARLLPEVQEVSIVAEQRHEIGADAEASLHQVVIEVEDERLPADEVDRDVVADRIVQTAERWAQACIADRHAEVTEL
jgi:hypothetical protein